MVTTLKQNESFPASYPPAPSGLSANAAALDADMIWQRIESYIAYRWTARTVVWTVDGGGAWSPPLTPAIISTTEVWQDNAWVTVALIASPLEGVQLPGDGPYRITASVGIGTVPAGVSEAFRRLAEYMAGQTDRAGVSRYSTEIGGAISESYDRNPAWLARAMQNSGAGDLLRNYRRV